MLVEGVQPARRVGVAFQREVRAGEDRRQLDAFAAPHRRQSGREIEQELQQGDVDVRFVVLRREEHANRVLVLLHVAEPREELPTRVTTNTAGVAMA